MKDVRLINKPYKILQTVMVSHYDRFFIMMICNVWILLVSCEQRKELLTEEHYDGPQFSMDSVFTRISDSAKIMVILRAAKQNNYENGNQDWPEGLYLEYLDGYGQVVSTFRSDEADYIQEENLYTGRGNVQVINIENGDKLNTEELKWDPQEGTFYTDRFVTIETDGEVHTGEGLTANQNFTEYEIHKPKGTITLDE